MFRHAFAFTLVLLSCQAMAITSLDEAWVAVKARQYLVAEEILRERVKQKDDDWEARFLLARVLAWQGQFDQAIEYYDELIRHEPENADFHFGLAQVHVWRAAPVEALPILETARKLAPDYMAIWALEITTLERLGGNVNIARAAQMREDASKRFHGSLAIFPPPDSAGPQPTSRLIGSELEPLLAFSARVISEGDVDVARRSTVEMAVSADQLSNGNSSWRGIELQLTHKIEERHLATVALRQTSRFGLVDQQLEVGYVFPLSRKVTWTVDVGVSPSHRVLAHTSLGTMMQYEFAPSWLAHAGIKHSSYESASVNQATLMLEHYFSAFRWAAAWRLTTAFGTFAHGAEVRFDYYYNDINRIGAVAAVGREAIAVDGLLISFADVRSLVLGGHHWINRYWALSYEIGSARQGTYYSRTGVRFGVRRAF